MIVLLPVETNPQAFMFSYIDLESRKRIEECIGLEKDIGLMRKLRHCG